MEIRGEKKEVEYECEVSEVVESKKRRREMQRVSDIGRERERELKNFRRWNG